MARNILAFLVVSGLTALSEQGATDKFYTFRSPMEPVEELKDSMSLFQEATECFLMFKANSVAMFNTVATGQEYQEDECFIDCFNEKFEYVISPAMQMFNMKMEENGRNCPFKKLRNFVYEQYNPCSDKGSASDDTCRSLVEKATCFYQNMAKVIL